MVKKEKVYLPNWCGLILFLVSGVVFLLGLIFGQGTALPLCVFFGTTFGVMGMVNPVYKRRSCGGYVSPTPMTLTLWVGAVAAFISAWWLISV